MNAIPHGRRHAGLWLLLALPLLASCGDGGGGAGGAGRESGGARPVNVLLIVVDTLGAEHLGCHDPSLASSPAIDRLAAEGVQFVRAHSVAPWTQPAVASLVTSRMPSDHGVRRIFDRLDGGQTTLAELLRGRGLATRGVISHFVIGREYGFDQGFDRYVESPVGGHRAVTSHLVTDRAIECLDAMRREPFFLFVHYFDPHWYYNHHPDFDLTSDYRGRLLPGMEIGGLRAMRGKLDAADVRYLENLYREEIAYTDHHVGRLLAHLRKLGLEESTLVILTADHGEEFMRHGWIGHTATLYQELIHVPLIFRLPGALAPRRIDEPVSILDVLPTVMDLLGASDPDAGWQGVSLRHWLEGEAGPTDRLLFSEVSYISPQGWPSGDGRVKRYFKTALVNGDRKVIHDLLDRAWESYDLAADPQELRNLWAEGPAGADELAALLRAWEEGRTDDWGVAADEDVVTDPAAIERLRSLGYVH